MKDSYLQTRRTLIYVSGPYRAATRNAVAENIRRAYDAAVMLWKLGAAVVCPHKNTEDMEGMVELTHILTGDFEMIRRSSAVFMLTGWEKSLGAQLERDVALDAGLPVFYQGAEDMMGQLKMFIERTEEKLSEEDWGNV